MARQQRGDRRILPGRTGTQNARPHADRLRSVASAYDPRLSALGTYPGLLFDSATSVGGTSGLYVPESTCR